MRNHFFTDRQQTILFSIVSFYILALPLILLDYNNGRAFYDQINFHLPTIHHFISHFDFSDYPSATTPGYHIILAIFGKIFSANEILLKLVSSIFTAIFIGLLANLLFENFGKIKTLILLLPMIFSIYIFPAGVWLLPDNVAWLTVAAIFIMSSKMPLSKSHYLYLCLLLLLAMLVRQPSLWLAVTIWSTGLAYFLFEKQARSKKISILIMAFTSTLPAFILFYIFYLQWGGLVPPTFQVAHEHMSFSVPAFFFSVFFVYTIFYFPIVFRLFVSLNRKYNYYWIGFGLLIGFIVSVLPDTSYNVELGRSSGLWNLVKVAPVVNNKSLLIILLSTLGGGLYFGLLLLVKNSLRLTILMSTLAFLLALTPNAFVYERYFSGFIFIVIFLLFGKANILRKEPLNRWVWLIPISFSILNILILVRSIL